MLPLSPPSGCAAARPAMPTTPSVRTATKIERGIRRSDIRLIPRLQPLVLPLRRRRVLLARRVPVGKRLLIFLFAEIDPADPRETHLVDRAVAVANPVLRIGIGAVGGRVVVPADDVNHRAGGDEWRGLVLVVVNGVPVVIPVRAIDRLAAHHVAGIARIDQLEALILAADVHVRLPGDDLAGLGVQRIAVNARYRTGRNVERVIGARRRIAMVRRVADELWHLTLWIQDEADLHLRVDLFADRVEMV